eukprot:10827797-Heterocapsa_arctica.AAC.1
MEIGLVDKATRRKNVTPNVNALPAPPRPSVGTGKGKGKGKFERKQETNVKVPEGWMMIRACKWYGGRHVDTMCPTKKSMPPKAAPPGK